GSSGAAPLARSHSSQLASARRRGNGRIAARGENTLENPRFAIPTTPEILLGCAAGRDRPRGDARRPPPLPTYPNTSYTKPMRSSLLVGGAACIALAATLAFAGNSEPAAALAGADPLLERGYYL